MAERTEQITAPDGGTFDGLVVTPSATTGPGILLLQEIFGVNDYLVAKARSLADLGYVVLCPDVFWRVERNVSLPHTDESMQEAFGYMTRYFELDPATNVGDLGAALAHLRGLPEVAGKVAVMGYCLGGALTYEVAVAHGPDAAVSYYGVGLAARLGVADQITCPVLFQFGGQDQFIPRDDVEAVRAAMGDRPNVELHVHEQAGHAFENFLAPNFHDPDAAAVSWPITVEFLARTLR